MRHYLQSYSLKSSIGSFVIYLYDQSVQEGGVWIFGFADLANFWFGFSVSALKNCGFSVLVFLAVCGFSPI